MTPMIDAVLVLIVLFLLSMRFQGPEDRLLTAIPRCTRGRPEPEAVRIVLRLNGSTVTVNVESIPIGVLGRAEDAAVCRAAARRARAIVEVDTPSESGQVLLDVAPDVPYGHVLPLLYALRRQGVRNLAFAPRVRCKGLAE